MFFQGGRSDSFGVLALARFRVYLTRVIKTYGSGGSTIPDAAGRRGRTHQPPRHGRVLHRAPGPTRGQAASETGSYSNESPLGRQYAKEATPCPQSADWKKRRHEIKRRAATLATFLTWHRRRQAPKTGISRVFWALRVPERRDASLARF